MKSNFFLSILSSIFFLSPKYSLCGQEPHFHIKGHIDGVHDEMIYLEESGYFYSLLNTAKIVDSCRINEGHYEFKGVYDRPFLYSIKIPSLTRKFYQFILEPGITVIESNVDRFYDSKITATKENILYETWEKEREQYKFPMNALIDSISKYGIDSTDSDIFYQKYDSINNVQKASAIKFIKNNPTSFVSLMILYSILTIDDDESAKKYFAFLSQDLRESVEGKLVEDKINASVNSLKNKKMPPFEMENFVGIKISSDQYKGKYLIIDFWATWCSPCIAKMPELIEIHKIHKNQIKVLSISLDRNLELCKQKVNELGMNWDNICDTQAGRSPTIINYNVKSIPRILVCDKEGIVIYDSDIDKKESLKDFIATLNLN
ncbi:TlpA disulfide reductase family protein [Sphingobacterium tabacisoli]|uniref:Thioredoxin-like domain-containing protein n=1 Tax=Sphingobacterium tabacisoli TaxID=2044855 RepID=A0ABW5KY37_9SPHI|nr:TlpA disulfide reductase family protein [Sphingobacterium tabacisoli]